MKRCAYVILRLFPVEGKGSITLVVVGESRGGCRRQRDALVGRTEQHEGLWLKFVECRGIKIGQSRKCRTAVKKACIKEVRAYSPGFEGKLPEAQHPNVQGKLQKCMFMLIRSGHFNT